MVGLTNFGLFFGIVNLMFSINKYLSNFFIITFDELLKVTTVLITNILLNVQIPMLHVLGDVLYLMCDVPGLIFCKILNL